MQNKPKKFWNFVQSDTENAELIIDGNVASKSWWGDEVTPEQFTKELKALGDVSNIIVRINSCGGDVFAANAIYTRLRDHKANITVKIDGWAASAATIICMAGDKICIPRNGVFMIHNPAAGLCGYYNEQDIEKINAELQVIKKSIINAYAARTGNTEEEISQLMTNETWWTGEEAVENGFCDELMFENIDYSVENSCRNYIVNEVSRNRNNFKIPEKIKNLIWCKKEEKKMSNEFSNELTAREEIALARPIMSIAKVDTVDELRDLYPELVAEIERSATAAERERFKSIEDCTLRGYEKIANEAKYDNPISAAEFSMKIIAAEKQKGAAYLQNVADDIANSGINNVQPSAAPAQGVNVYDAAIEKMLPNK